MAMLLSLVEHLLNVKDVEVIKCDLSQLKAKNINNTTCLQVFYGMKIA